MPAPPPEENAKRENWKTLPLPEIRVDLGFTDAYTGGEFGRMRKGVIPREMEDKWFVFYEEPWLYFHRSWTGACIYGVRFQESENRVSTIESWVNRDTNQYKETRTDYDRALLKFLIDAFLLGEHATFPVPSNVPAQAPAGAYQHHLVGRGYPEAKFSASAQPEVKLSVEVRQPRSFWQRNLAAEDHGQ
ncbi:MAG: hypothetical protein WDN28_17315 [Chthoniobacter sp.]